jgi:hypothetical protein
MLSPLRRTLTLAALLTVIGTANASAQTPDVDPDRQPISPFVFDVRGVFAKYPSDTTIAPFLGVTHDNIVKRAFGVLAGAHVYPLRRRITLGFGAEMLISRGKRTIKVTTEDDPPKEVDGPTVSARLDAVSPQVSLNFGRRSGWSYVSGGIGWTRFDTKVVDEDGVSSAPADESAIPRARTITYGGGARWFAKEHLAFCFDIRFYAVNPQAATATRPALARTRLVMASVGVSLR